MLKSLLEEYYYLITENISLICEYPFLLNRCKNTFKDEPQLQEQLKKVTYEYLKSSLMELKLYNYMLKNQRKIYEDDIYEVLDDLDCLQYNKSAYKEEAYDKMEEAISMEYRYRFHLPKQKEMYLTEDKIDKYKIRLQGFSDTGLERFLLEEQIYNEEIIKEILNLRTKLDIPVKDNENIFGVKAKELDNEVYIERVIVPVIKDDLSFLVNIHELVHSAVMQENNLINEINIYNEDIPIFYEQICKMKNNFIKTDLHKTKISEIMVKEYKNEPFKEQLEKYKYYVKKIN